MFGDKRKRQFATDVTSERHLVKNKMCPFWKLLNHNIELTLLFRLLIKHWKVLPNEAVEFTVYGLRNFTKLSVGDGA